MRVRYVARLLWLPAVACQERVCMPRSTAPTLCYKTKSRLLLRLIETFGSMKEHVSEWILATKVLDAPKILLWFKRSNSAGE